jgi:hypothetical protein
LTGQRAKRLDSEHVRLDSDQERLDSEQVRLDSEYRFGRTTSRRDWTVIGEA